MRALTVRQPWASLIAVGAKHYETRSWWTRHRGPLAIHAGMALDISGLEQTRLIEKALRLHGFRELLDLPHGLVVAVGQLVEVRRAEHLRSGLGREQLAFGDFSDGRFAWDLVDVRRLDPPVPPAAVSASGNGKNDERLASRAERRQL